MRAALAIALVVAASVAGIGEAAAGKAKPVRSKVSLAAITSELATGKVTARGQGVPARVKRDCRRRRQVIVFEQAAPQDFLVARDLTNKRGKWSATPTAGSYLSVPHHAIVVATTVRDRKTDRKFRCKGATSASVTPSPGPP